MPGTIEATGAPDIKPAAMPSMPDMSSAAGLAANLDNGPAAAGIRTLAAVDAPQFLQADGANAGKSADQVLGGAIPAQGAEAGVVGQPGLNEATKQGGGAEAGTQGVSTPDATGDVTVGTADMSPLVPDQSMRSEGPMTADDVRGHIDDQLKSGRLTEDEASAANAKAEQTAAQNDPANDKPLDFGAVPPEPGTPTRPDGDEPLAEATGDGVVGEAEAATTAAATTPDAGAEANNPPKSAFELAKDALRARIAAGEKIERTGYNPVLEAVLAENATASNRSVDAATGTAPASTEAAKPVDAAARTEAFKPGTRSEADVAKILGTTPPEAPASKLGGERTSAEVSAYLAPTGESPYDRPKDAPATGDSDTLTTEDFARETAENPAPPDVVDKATARQARMDELKGKIDSNKANYNDLAEYQRLKSRPEDPAARMEELKSRAESGDMTDAEMNEYVSLKGEVNGEVEEATAETSLDQQVEDMGTDLMEKMANGEAPTDEQVEEFQRLRTEQIVQQNGFSKEQSREAVKAMIEKKNGNERRRRKNTALENKIKELMTIDMQIMMIPKMLDKLREQRRPLIEKARQQHSTARTPENRAQEYQTLAQLGSINTAISEMKGQGLLLSTRRMVLEAAARRGTGVTGPLRSVVEFATAHVADIAVKLGTELADDVEARALTYAA